MTFTAKTVAERTEPGQRQTIDDEEFSAFIYRPRSPHSDVVIVTVTTKTYPQRAAQCIGPQVMKEFRDRYTDKAEYESGVIASWPYLKQRLDEVQSPERAMDKVAKIQSELDATKEVMHKNIEQVLERGERMEDLLERTNELDLQTKLFVKSAKKANRGCCSLQ